MRVERQTGATHASEESFEIYAGSEMVVSQVSANSNELTSYEYCLPITTNYQYVLYMKDSIGDSWSDGSWIALYGLNGDVVYKGIMVEPSEEAVPFSLYSPIDKGANGWLYTSTYTQGWNTVAFTASNWQTVNLASPTISATGTQYFRKMFTGIPDMAAIEAQFKYSDGIVAYINGVEIYRDNMPTGTIAQGTLATNMYATWLLWSNPLLECG